MANINPKNASQIKGDLSAAHDIFKKYLTNTKHFEAHIHMGLVLHKKCNLNAAIMIHQKGVSIKPDYFEAFNNMENVFEDNDNLDLAIEAYKKALNI